jgi:hypothetical protein
MKPEIISSILAGSCQGRYQVAHPGSYAIIARRDYQVGSNGLEFSLFFQSHLVEAKHIQTLVSTLDVSEKTGYAAILTAEGYIEFWIGTGNTVEVVSTGFKPDLKRWIELRFTIRGADFSYEIHPKSTFTDMPQPSNSGKKTLDYEADVTQPCILVLSAMFAVDPDEGSSQPINFFNGRIDSPTMRSACTNYHMLAKWDFSLKISTDSIVDVFGNRAGAEGRLINAPTRAVTGHDWDGMESDWTKAKYGYGAIHFHEDDLDDAAWETDFSITLPENLRSGVYAVEIEAQNGNARDTVPFYVRPTLATSAALGAKVAYIISTFTVSATFFLISLHLQYIMTCIHTNAGFKVSRLCQRARV